MKKKPTKKPRRKSLGQFTDELFDIDMEIKAQEAALSAKKKEREGVEFEMLKAFKRAGLKGCKGDRATATVMVAEFPSIKNRKAFDAYVRKNRAFDLFQSRVMSSAYFARLEEGEAVPGVEIFKRTKVSVRKR